VVKFKEVPIHMLLKLNRYLFWAHQKLNTHFFMENKDKISDDLLEEFRGGFTGNAPSIDKKGSKGPTGLKQADGKLKSLLDFQYGAAVNASKTDSVDIHSTMDFPTLGGGLAP
jgi:hypothetical protein